MSPSMTAAARWQPDSGIFAATTGFDPRLFDGAHHLRPEVRRDVMERLDQALRVDGGLTGSDWQDYLRVYLAGGSASEWAGGRPNDAAQDFDVLIGVAYGKYRGSQPGSYQPPDRAIDSELNAALRKHFNDPAWRPSFGGTWSLTGFVNPAAWDIRKIKPYAAWDISNMVWAVRPPHLPEHSVADFDPAVLAEARAVATMARAILRLPEPSRTRQARALLEHIRADRSRAFSAGGEGWQDPGNVLEKYLAYAPGNLLNKIKDLVYAVPKTAATQPLPPDLREAGLNGQVPAGMTFHHVPSGSHFEPHMLYARHPGAPDGEVPDEAGHIKWWGDSGEITHIGVHPDYQRRGVATELFRRARTIDPGIRHSDALSEDGRQWAARQASGSDGDRFVTCQQGHEHWGAYGAAGLLIRHKGDDGRYRYLLQKRSDSVDHPGLWSIPSGAKGRDETPEQGAMREAREEIGPLPRYLARHHTITSTDCGDWKFHTVVADAGEHFTPRGGGETDHESAGAAWFTPREIRDLDLHPAFARSWDQVRRSRGPGDAAREAGRREAVKGYDLKPRSAMIYLDIPEGTVRKVPGGVDESHITLVYLGKDVSDGALAEACRRAQKAAARCQPLHGILHGIGTFPPSNSSDQKVPAFVPAYVPGIGVLRRELEDLNASQHKDYRPHVTLAYLEEGDQLPPPHPPVHLAFTHLSVKRGDDVAHFPLGRPGLRAEARNRPASFSPALGHRIIQRTARGGGHSISLTSGRSPSEGYMVAQKEGSHVIPARDFFGENGHRILGDYVQAHHEDFSRRGAHLGSWHDHESGNVFLDISHNVRHRQEAEKMAQEHDQIAIWDLKNKTEVPTGGTGGLKAEGSARDTCGTCGLPTAPVSATMEFFRRGGQDAQD